MVRASESSSRPTVIVAFSFPIQNILLAVGSFLWTAIPRPQSTTAAKAAIPTVDEPNAQRAHVGQRGLCADELAYRVLGAQLRPSLLVPRV